MPAHIGLRQANHTTVRRPSDFNNIDSSCNHALLTLRTAVNHYVKDDTTVNVCALDLSKAFDRVDQFALLQLLIDRISQKILLL